MDFDQVYQAYKKCAKGKRKSHQCTRFEQHLGYEVSRLVLDINNRKYNPRPSRCFIVEKPKLREIWASDFRDRIVHHLIVAALEKIWEPKFSAQTFACRKGKGIFAAFRYADKQVRRISDGRRRPVWALQLDVDSFFVNIDRLILKDLFLSRAHDPEIRWLIAQTFDHDPRDNFRRVGSVSLFEKLPPNKSWLSKSARQGIPIGNLTSQFGANLYLNELDHWIQRQLRPQAYLRYMDDLLLLDSDPEKLASFIEVVDSRLLETRRLRLNPSKTVLRPLQAGIDYLGFHLIHDVGRNQLVLLPSRKKAWDLIKDLRRLEKINWDEFSFDHSLSFANMSQRRAQLQTVNARLGMLVHGRSYQLRHHGVGRLLAAETSASIYLASRDASALRC